MKPTCKPQFETGKEAKAEEEEEEVPPFEVIARMAEIKLDNERVIEQLMVNLKIHKNQYKQIRSTPDLPEYKIVRFLRQVDKFALRRTAKNFLSLRRHFLLAAAEGYLIMEDNLCDCTAELVVRQFMGTLAQLLDFEYQNFSGQNKWSIPLVPTGPVNEHISILRTTVAQILETTSIPTHDGLYSYSKDGRRLDKKMQDFRSVQQRYIFGGPLDRVDCYEPSETHDKERREKLRNFSFLVPVSERLFREIRLHNTRVFPSNEPIEVYREYVNEEIEKRMAIRPRLREQWALIKANLRDEIVLHFYCLFILGESSAVYFEEKNFESDASWAQPKELHHFARYFHGVLQLPDEELDKSYTLLSKPYMYGNSRQHQIVVEKTVPEKEGSRALESEARRDCCQKSESSEGLGCKKQSATDGKSADQQTDSSQDSRLAVLEAIIRKSQKTLKMMDWYKDPAPSESVETPILTKSSSNHQSEIPKDSETSSKKRETEACKQSLSNSSSPQDLKILAAAAIRYRPTGACAYRSPTATLINIKRSQQKTDKKEFRETFYNALSNSENGIQSSSDSQVEDVELTPQEREEIRNEVEEIRRSNKKRRQRERRNRNRKPVKAERVNAALRKRVPREPARQTPEPQVLESVQGIVEKPEEVSVAPEAPREESPPPLIPNEDLPLPLLDILEVNNDNVVVDDEHQPRCYSEKRMLLYDEIKVFLDVNARNGRLELLKEYQLGPRFEKFHKVYRIQYEIALLFSLLVDVPDRGLSEKFVVYKARSLICPKYANCSFVAEHSEDNEWVTARIGNLDNLSPELIDQVLLRRGLRIVDYKCSFVSEGDELYTPYRNVCDKLIVHGAEQRIFYNVAKNILARIERGESQT